MRENIDGPYLLVSVELPKSYSDFGHWRAAPVYKTGDSIVNASYDNELNDFEVTAAIYGKSDITRYASDEASRKAEPTTLHRVGFHQSLTVELNDAERYIKVLRRIDKSLKAQYETYGPATDYSDFLARVAVAIKAKGFLIEGDPKHNGEWGYRAYSYRDMTLPQIKWHIERTHREYIDSLFPEQKVA